MVGDEVWYNLDRDTGEHLPFVYLPKAKTVNTVTDFRTSFKCGPKNTNSCLWGIWCFLWEKSMMLEKLSTMN